MKNIYDDDIFDIKQSSDLNDLDQIHLLANNSDTIKFRLGHDFFSFDKDSELLLQYPDYKSLYENTNSKIIYDNGTNVNNDYGNYIVKGLQEIDFNNFKEFELDDKHDFIVTDKEPGLKIKFGNLKKSKEVQGELNNISEKLIQTEELKSVKKMIDGFSSLFSLLFLLKLNKDKTKLNENKEIIELIIDELKNDRIDFDKIYNDKNLLDKVPGLKEVLEDYKKNHIKDFELKFQSDGTVLNNYFLLEQGQKLETLLLESNIKKETLLLTYDPKSVLNTSIIPKNNDTLEFVKDFITYDNTLNYNAYSSNEIAAATLLTGIKADIADNKFNKNDNYLAEFFTLVNDNDLDLIKIDNLAEKMVLEMSVFENDLKKGFTLIS